MAISDFRRVKKLKVTEVSGQPTISRTACLKITSGDDATTGTGEIVLDWSNIDSKADIGVYDQNNNLLDYYFESFDANNENAVIWVFKDWVRDGTIQAKIAYGNGTSDQSVAASTVFSKESNLTGRYLFNEESGDLLDVSGKDNDGTVNGPTQGAEGVVDGAYDFDGNDDYINLGTPSGLKFGDEDFSIIIWIKPDSVQDYGEYGLEFLGDSTTTTGLKFGINDDDRIFIKAQGESGTASLLYNNFSTNWTMLTLINDSANSTVYAYRNFDEYTDSESVVVDGNNQDVLIGYTTQGGWDGYFRGLIDNIHFYSTNLSSEDHAAIYDSTKLSPEFFSQEAVSGFATISGQVTLSGSGVEGAKLFLVNETIGELEATTTTDADGNYSFDISGDTYHVAVQYDDGSQKYNDYSKPYLIP